MKRLYFILIVLVTSLSSYSQSKLTREQILNAVRTHQNVTDSVSVIDTDTIKCDARTTSIDLYVYNDSTANGHTYCLSCNKDGIDLAIYDEEIVIYKSSFDYKDINYYALKSKINKSTIVKCKSTNDEEYNGVDQIIRFYRGEHMYESIESYSGKTNSSKGVHIIADIMSGLIPKVSEILNSLTNDVDTIISNIDNVQLTFSEDTVSFKQKGKEFKKVKVSCSVEDWSIVGCPDWISYSLNKNDEIVLESQKNETKHQREGEVIVECGCVRKSIKIIQFK